MDFVEEAKEYDSFSDKIKVITNEIKNIVLESKSEIEGNSFYDDNTLTRNYRQQAKQINLFALGKNAGSNICEIGFNAGHSTILMLIGREKTPLNYTIFDIGRHPYTIPCLNYLQLQFQNVNFEYIEGDSTQTMQKWLETNKDKIGIYDLIHVDGGHSEECIQSDMKNADRLIKANGLIIVDDTYATQINNCVEQYLAKGDYKEIKGLDTTFFPHRIIQKAVL